MKKMVMSTIIHQIEVNHSEIVTVSLHGGKIRVLQFKNLYIVDIGTKNSMIRIAVS